MQYGGGTGTSHNMCSLPRLQHPVVVGRQGVELAGRQGLWDDSTSMTGTIGTVEEVVQNTKRPRGDKCFRVFFERRGTAPPPSTPRTGYTPRTSSAVLGAPSPVPR